jgi:hypothetical protein
MLVIASTLVTTDYPDINIDVCLRLMDAKLTGAGTFGVLIAAPCRVWLPAAAALVGGLTTAALAVPAVAGEVLSMPQAIARGRKALGGLLERDAQEAAHADPNRA